MTSSSQIMIPDKYLNLKRLLLACLLIQTAAPSIIKRNDFGGEFSGSSVSGSDAPGPTANTMGDKAASAMAIGTGTAGAGDYTSNYKTPNYTQYTSQDFKEYMPNYQELMESSMDKMSGMGGGTSSMGFGNFSAVGAMLKAFMDLQKEQLAVEKAKTEANKAKVDLEMNYEDVEDESEDENENEARDMTDHRRRRKRSLLTLLSPGNSVIPFGVAKPSPSMSRPILRPQLPTAPQPLVPPPPMVRPMPTPFNKSDSPDATLTEDEKRTLKKILGLLEMPQVKTLLTTMTSLSGKAPAKRRSRQSGSQTTPTSSSMSPPPTVPNSPPPPPTQTSSQSSQQSDNDWKKYLGSPTSNSPTASGSGGDWSKYMGSSTSSGSWGGSSQSKRDQEGTMDDGSKSGGWSNPGWSSGSSGGSPGQSWGSDSKAPPSQGSFDWSKGSGSSGTPWSSGGSQSRGLRGLMGDSPMSPVHGSMNLMNLPMYSSPTPNNIPNLSFSLNPSTPDAEEDEPEEEKDETKNDEYPKRPSLIFALPKTSPLQTPSILLPQMSPAYQQVSSPSLMMQPLSYEDPTTMLQAPSILYPQGSYVQSQPMTDSYVIREPLEPPMFPSLYNGPKPMFYNTPSPKFYNSPIMSSSGELLGGGAMPLEQQPILATNEPLQLYRLGRSSDIDDDSPISIYKVTKNDDNGIDEIKKLIFDIDNGIIVSQTDRSKEELPEITAKKHISKRSIFDEEDESEEGGFEDIPFVRVPFFKGTEKLLKMNHHFEDEGVDDDRQRRPSSTPESTPIPEMTSSNVTTLKEDSRSSGYQYQADGSDTDYDYAESPQVDEGPESQTESRRRNRREVSIGFDQKGELPPGSTETVSAGGGRSPGHHEGGGLTVKVNDSPDIEEEEEEPEESSEKEELRSFNRKKVSPKKKTLNFYFTW